eukprot:520189-Pelagomonas_calceolata.AAC.2
MRYKAPGQLASGEQKRGHASKANSAHVILPRTPAALSHPHLAALRRGGRGCVVGVPSIPASLLRRLLCVLRVLLGLLLLRRRLSIGSIGGGSGRGGRHSALRGRACGSVGVHNQHGL